VRGLKLLIVVLVSMTFLPTCTELERGSREAETQDELRLLRDIDECEKTKAISWAVFLNCMEGKGYYRLDKEKVDQPLDQRR
jgi:hypothetical protein